MEDKMSEMVSALMAANIKQICDMVINDGLTSFEVKFEFNGKKYHLALIENGQVNNKKFELNYN